MTRHIVKVNDNKDYTGPLNPPDKERCQVEHTERAPFALGGTHRTTRCDAKPIVIATEREPMKDGRRGKMSLCAEHKEMLDRHCPGDAPTG